mmetsp:Transcript_118101/g.220808  ORF Transcript_118101/g.220808 Transcript_118101/m.220808 type:complete len:1022 (+) Transcript_118101:138-3203(+)
MAAYGLGALLMALTALMAFPSCSAVDRSKFRTCEQGSFCRRYKKWIARPDIDKPLWSIVPGSRQTWSSGNFSFMIKHVAEAEAHLMLRLEFFAAGIVRARLGEIDPVFPRHEIPHGDVIHETLPASAEVKVEGDSIFTFTTTAGAAVKVELKTSPLALDMSINGQLVQRLNARNFLNYERYRKPKAYRPSDPMASDADADKVTLDAAAHPHSLDTNGLWEESFGGHTDKKPRGPASFGIDLSFEGHVPALFGLPEHATKASLPFYDEPYRFYNLDVFEYEVNEPMALYGTIPFLWAIHQHDGDGPHVTSGFLWINPSETFIKLEQPQDPKDRSVQSWWTSESGSMDFAFFVGPTPPDISGQFHALTGNAPLPPQWALGKHQCRWNYMNEKDVATVDSSYDKYDIPYDVIWLDIEHTDGKAYFSWNSANFPTPEKMTEALSLKKRKLVNVVDPHIKKSESFHVFKEVRDQGMFIKKVDWKMIDDPTEKKPEDWVEEKQILDPSALTAPEGWNEEEDGKYEVPKIDNPAYKGEWTAKQITDPSSPLSDYEGWCWPGTSGYPDFSDPKMREYWGSQFALGKYKGTNADTYIWNDMNEPSVFNGPEVTMPRDAIHPHGNVEHRDLHNMYGYYVHRATFEGLQKRTPGDRPFVLTRSFFIGSHKYCAIWTGDNAATWEQLGVSIPMIGALTVAGQSLVGADVGGFFKHPDAELVTRWYQLAVLAYPFLRNHAHLETPRREPYTYDEATMGRVKAAIQTRYKMLPLWYTLFEEYHRLGRPVVRPLFWNFIEDHETHHNAEAVEHEIMLGHHLLVHGISSPLNQHKGCTIYLPSGKHGGWYEMNGGGFHTPGQFQMDLSIESIPAFWRAGIVVPLKSRIRRSSECMKQDPLTLAVYLTPSGEATGRVYLDDYRTHAYKDGKSFLSVEFAYFHKSKEHGGELRPTSAEGALPADIAAEVEKVEIFGLHHHAGPASTVLKVKGAEHKLTTMSWPITTDLRDSHLWKAVIKVQPWINLRDGLNWALKIGTD